MTNIIATISLLLAGVCIIVTYLGVMWACLYALILCTANGIIGGCK